MVSLNLPNIVPLAIKSQSYALVPHGLQLLQVQDDRDRLNLLIIEVQSDLELDHLLLLGSVNLTNAPARIECKPRLFSSLLLSEVLTSQPVFCNYYSVLRRQITVQLYPVGLALLLEVREVVTPVLSRYVLMLMSEGVRHTQLVFKVPSVM